MSRSLRLRRPDALLAAAVVAAVGCGSSSAMGPGQPGDGPPAVSMDGRAPGPDAGPPLDDAGAAEVAGAGSEGGAGDAVADAGGVTDRSSDLPRDTTATSVPDAVAPGADVLAGPRALCGGEARVTFTYVRVAALARHAPGSQVIWENGTTYLYIDGQCRYWVFGNSRGVNETDETRTGTLAAADARRLAQEIKYADWPTLKGEWRGMLHDATPDVFTDGTNTISCEAKCSFAGPPPAVRELYTVIDGWLDLLNAAGQPMTGPVRLAVVNLEDSYPGWPHKFADWPLSDPMAGYVVPYTITRPGTSKRVEAPGAALLRDLRARQRMRAFSPAGTGSFIPVRERNGPLHGLYLRDVLPFENAQGLVVN